MKKVYFAVLLVAVLFLAGCSKNGVAGNVVKDTVEGSTEKVADVVSTLEEKSKKQKTNNYYLTDQPFSG